MAVESLGYRKGAIAISAGLGVALPLAAYAATLPFDGVNEAIRSDILPLVAGSLAGVGLLAISGHLMNARAERLAEEQVEAARFKSAFADARSAASTHVSRAGSRPHGHRGGRSATPDGVPVISRAVDALDEAEAWAEIDAMFSGDSPFSCDPTRSKSCTARSRRRLRRLPVLQLRRPMHARMSSVAMRPWRLSMGVLLRARPMSPCFPRCNPLLLPSPPHPFAPLP